MGKKESVRSTRDNQGEGEMMEEVGDYFLKF